MPKEKTEWGVKDVKMVEITKEHKPEDRGERERIEMNGGSVR